MKLMNEVTPKKYYGVLQRAGKIRTKRKGFALTLESIAYVLFIALLITLGVGLRSYKTWQVVMCKWEVSEISSAMSQYNAYSLKNTYPADLKTLLSDSALSASESVDGMPHGPFLKESSRWKGDNILDPWGESYTIEGNQVVGGASSTFGPFKSTFRSTNEE